MKKALHIITQDNQPYGSVRKCCERCGLAVCNCEFYVRTKSEYTKKLADDNNLIRCIDKEDI